MSLNQKKTMQVFNKTCINQSTMSFTKPSDLPKEPLTHIKISDYKKSYPMIIG